MTRLIAPPVTYRIYDEADRLLYVGVSHDPGHRVSQHRSGKAWGQRVARVTETFWRDPVDALLDERAATYHEDPEFPTPVAGKGAMRTARLFVSAFYRINRRGHVDATAVLDAGGYTDPDACTPHGEPIPMGTDAQMDAMRDAVDRLGRLLAPEFYEAATA